MNDAMTWMAYLMEMLKPVVAVMKPKKMEKKADMSVKTMMDHAGMRTRPLTA